MRLSEHYRVQIRAAATDVFGSDVVVRLFGSRVDDHCKGGDIDLHLEVGPDADIATGEIRFRAELWKRLDEEQVDVIIARRGDRRRWIDETATREGILV